MQEAAMRTKLFLKNSIIILVTKLICYLGEFLCRTVLIHTLPMEYVGVTGLFSNILAVLSLSELGFGTVMVYSMYVPLAHNDEDRLLALTDFYKKAYGVIAIVLAVTGASLTPFLPYVINDCPDLPGLSLFYLLFLANAVFSYFFMSRQSLFLADQKLYIINIYSNLLRIIRIILQMILLTTTHSFFLYLLIPLPFTLLTNLLLSWRAPKYYPFLNAGRHPVLHRDERKSIFKNVYAMFNHRIGNTILTSTDNLLISFFLGLTEVSRNDCYCMVLNLLRYLTTPLFSSLTAGVGNYYATRTKEDTCQLFKALHFAGFWFYTFCTISFLLLINPFISFLWGGQFLFPMPVVLLISANYFITGIRQVPITFKEAIGLLCQDRYKPLLESLINLFVSILLVRSMGISGIFAGTFVSMVATSLWIEPLVLFKYGFGRSVKTFWRSNLKYFLAGAASFGLTCLCCMPIGLSGLPLLTARAVVCLIVPNAAMVLFFCRSDEFKYILGLLQTAFSFHFPFL